MKKRLIIALCVCLTVSVTACSQNNSIKEPEISQGQLIKENPLTPSERETLNESSVLSDVGEPLEQDNIEESNNPDNQVINAGAHPVKLENKWDYQNGYPVGYEHPSHILEIPSNPFYIPEQLSGNYTTSPWIITQGTLSDSTYLPDTYIVTSYENDSNYIQVSVEASYGIAYHRIPGQVSPYYIDCMLLYAFNNSEIEKCDGILIIGDRKYQASKLTEHVIYSDEIITVYNALTLISHLSFEEKLTEFFNNPTSDYDEGIIDGFSYKYDDIVKVKDYLTETIPKMIHKC